MRVQMQGQTVRLRLQEAELEQLLEGGEVGNRTRLPDGSARVQRISLSSRLAWRCADDGWHATLPATDVRAYSRRLPSREGLRFVFEVGDGAQLELLFDVDVRDSTRKRLGGHPPKETS